MGSCLSRADTVDSDRDQRAKGLACETGPDLDDQWFHSRDLAIPGMSEARPGSWSVSSILEPWRAGPWRRNPRRGRRSRWGAEFHEAAQGVDQAQLVWSADVGGEERR